MCSAKRIIQKMILWKTVCFFNVKMSRRNITDTWAGKNEILGQKLAALIYTKTGGTFHFWWWQLGNVQQGKPLLLCIQGMQRFEVARSIKMGLNSNILKRHTHFFLWCRQTFAVWRMFIQFLYTKVNSVYRNFWHLRVTFLNNSNKFSNLINVIKYLLATFACKNFLR